MKVPPSAWHRAAGLAGIGIEMVVAVVIGAQAGAWADARWDIGPWGTLGGLAMGGAAAARTLARLVARLRPTRAPPDGPASTKDRSAP